MEMHQVRYFLAVSRTLNFTRAAAECHVAQPSLTRAIKLLEAELGGDLFRRERNFTHMTEFGQRMLPLLQQCHDSAASAKKLAVSLKKGAVVQLTVSLSHAVDLRLLVEPLREMIRIFPTLELKILRGTLSEVADQLKRGEAGLAISGPLNETWERLDSWALFVDPFEAIVSLDHSFAARDRISVEDLVSERILSRPYCELAAVFEEKIGRQGTMAGGHAVTVEADLMRLVEANLGIAVLPSSTWCTTRVRTLQVEGLELERTVSLYGVAGRERSAPETAFMKLVRARDWSEALPNRTAA